MLKSQNQSELKFYCKYGITKLSLLISIIGFVFVVVLFILINSA